MNRTRAALPLIVAVLFVAVLVDRVGLIDAFLDTFNRIFNIHGKPWGFFQTIYLILFLIQVPVWAILIHDMIVEKRQAEETAKQYFKNTSPKED